jgi:ubiquinone/menaquinone biosynthesis C-methylase UbiE
MEARGMKLNLGSGISGLAALDIITHDYSGWKSIEICESYKADEHYDISTGIREKDNSIEEIWMGDFFEHLLRVKAKFVMGECFRVLKYGGRLRISVPDMAVVMPLWLAHQLQPDLPPQFTNGIPMINPMLAHQLYTCIWGDQDEKNQKNQIPDSHFNGYTEKSLRQMIRDAGFTRLNRIPIHGVWYELAMDVYK